MPRELTVRHKILLQMIADGIETPEMCYHTGISTTTHKHDMVKIFNKLGVSSRAHAVATAFRQGLIK